MSARAVLHQAVLDTLASDTAVAGEATVLRAPAPTPAHPWVLPEELLLAEWGTKDAPGCEARGAVTIRDVAADAERVRRLTGAVEAALERLPRDLGDGWSCTGAVVLRSRVARTGGKAGEVPRWTGSVEFRVRMLRTG